MNTARRINELNAAEEPAKELLRKLGYTYVPREVLALERDGERAVLLEDRLKQALLRLNDWLAGDDAERVIFQIRNLNAVGIARNQAVHERLVYGMTIDVDTTSGRRTRVVRFFDFDNPESGLNEFLVTTQFRVRRGNERAGTVEDDEKLVIPDIVLFVNGIPLVVMEAKSPTLGDTWRIQAVRQLRRYQEADAHWHGRGAPDLFDYNLLCIALCGADAAYGPIGAAENQYAAWKSLEPYSVEEARVRFGADPDVRRQDYLMIGLLAPAMLLDVLRDYVVFESEGGRLVKKLPRYQQHRAVTAAMERILTKTKPAERGGVVWHTQGSGKSLTMLYLSTKLRRESRLANPMIVIVTDRTQLDTQITKTFERCGFPAPEQARSSISLREMLAQGAGRTIMTTVQKFEDAVKIAGETVDALNDADNIIVIVDEAHRTQYGVLAAKMRAALPNGVFIGFTGTPIDKGFKRSTMTQFGPLLDAYSIPKAVEDGATVPIFYEARLADLSLERADAIDRVFEALFRDEPEENREQIRRRYATKETIATADKRIEQIALDIADHFREVIQPNGFKAQVVAPNREAAVRYAENLCSFGLSAYPVISTTKDDKEKPIFNAARQLDQNAIINSFKDPDGEAQILVVVDMLLTGFDAPIEQALYLDRELKDHNLLQAIARVNRPCTVVKNGVPVEKTYGLVVDYWGVSQHLDEALDAFESQDTQGAWEELAEDPTPVIGSVARKAESYFKGKDLEDTWECVQVFAPDVSTIGDFKADVFEKFNRDYREFAQLLDRFLPDPQALPYVARLANLTAIRNFVRAQYLREDSRIDWDGVSEKVKKLINERIDAEVRSLMAPVSILDKDFTEKISELPHDEARASVMEHAIRAQIKERIAENPVFYQKLSEQLEQIIEKMRQRIMTAAEAFRALSKLRQEALSVADVAAQQGLSEFAFGVYELLQQQAAVSSGETGLGDGRETRDAELKQAALEIQGIVQQGQEILDWQQKDDVIRIMRRDAKRRLRQLPDFPDAQINDLINSIVEMAKRKSAA